VSAQHAAQRHWPHDHGNSDYRADEPASDDDSARARTTASARIAPAIGRDERPAHARGSLTSNRASVLHYRSTTRDETNEYDHDRNHEQQMDQPAGDVKHAEAEDPENEEDYRKSPKHCRSPQRRVNATPLS